MLYDLYASRIPVDAEKLVEAAKDVYNSRIRTRLSTELALNLQTKNGGTETKIKILVERGRGGPLQKFLDQQEKDFLPEYFKIWERDIRHLYNATNNLSNAIRNINQYYRDIKDYEWPILDTIIKKSQCLDETKGFAGKLLEIISSADLANSIFRIQEDVLGLYCPDPKNSKSGEVILFYEPIAICAERLDVDITSLAAVVLIHELAHGYTHLGKDGDNFEWDLRDLFTTENRGVAEGLAQYYTDVVSEYLGDTGFESVHKAYLKLRRQQAGIYRIHDKWVTSFAREDVRGALVNFRRNRLKSLQIFNDLLIATNKSLKSTVKPFHPRVELDIHENGPLSDDLEGLIDQALITVYTEETDKLSARGMLKRLAEAWEIPAALDEQPLGMVTDPWKFSFSKDFRKSTDTLDAKLRGKIFSVIADITEDPITPKGHSKIPLTKEKRFENVYRYRVEGYRLLYYVNLSKKEVELLSFDTRDEAYD